MTELERKRVVDILTAKIQASESGSINLNQVSPILQGADIDRSIYGGVGPKRWLNEFFPEFAIDGNYGLETVRLSGNPDAWELQKVASSLENYLNQEGPLLFAIIPDRLRNQCGIDYHKYAEGKGLQQWLLSTFPQFDKSEDGRFLVLRTEQTAPQPSEGTEESRQMHALAFMNWWSVNAKQLRQYNAFSELKDIDIRDTVAHQMAAALLGQSGLLLSALHDDPPRLAFPTGLTARNGAMIYCVLGLNPRNENGTKQYLSLVGFCYPDEPSESGLGRWLAERFGLSAHQVPVTDHAQLRSRVEGLQAAREALIPQVEGYLETLTRGEAPTVPLEKQISGYERRWSELVRMLRDFPALNAQQPLTLDNLAEQVDQYSECAELAAQAAGAMEQVIAGVCRLYEANHLCDLQDATPERDRKQLEELRASQNGQVDVAALLALLRPYQKLLAVMKARVYQDVEEELEEVTGHFTEISYKFAAQILIDSREEDYRPLLDLERIEAMVRQCRTVAAAKQVAEELPAEQLDADSLLDAVLHPGKDWPLRWMACVNSLMPEDEGRKALVLGDSEALRRLLAGPDAKKLEHITMEVTPFGAGSRLLAVLGNRDRLAEKYLILGLQYDAERVLPVLYRLYRETGRKEQFETLWRAYSGRFPYSDDDLVYWLTTRCTDPGAEAGSLDELETALAQRPALLKNEQMKQSLAQLTPQLQHRPAAFWSWLRAGSVPCNTFETALENNDLERIYAALDDGTAMETMGYTAEEQVQIRAALRQDLPAGTDRCARALRILEVQGNKNGTAEGLLWAASAYRKAALALFDLYDANGDCASVCWLVTHFSLNFEERDARMDAYIRNLVGNHDRKTLDGLMRAHPALWYGNGLLDELAGGELEQPEEERFWTPIRDWHAAHPISEGCPFEQALAQGGLAAAQEYLAQTEQMEAWGYDEALRQQMQHMLAQSAEPEEGERAAVQRIRAFQRNLHRFLEGYLYRSLKTGQEWVYQELFQLMSEEERHMETAAYYDAYPVLRNSEQNTARCLWSLAALKRYELLLQRAEANPRCLQRDAALAQTVFQSAEACGRPEFVTRVRRVMNLLPKNRFEENIIHLDLPSLQQMISDPSQLLELGYTRETINHFKECLSKTLPNGNDTFAVGSRVRMFLGDARAEQFLIDSEEDPRSARLLSDMYTKAGRWDDLCYLYRRHEARNVWNDHYKKLYISALAKTTSPENCAEFIRFIDETPQIDKGNSEVQWLYLRALVGAGRLAESAQQEEQILTGGVQFKSGIAASLFDLLWDSGEEERREHAVIFAAKLCERYQDRLTPEELKMVAGVNGHLLETPDRERWAEFLRQRGLDGFLWLLNCCFGFDLEDSPEKAERFTQALKARLDNVGSQKLPRPALTLYSEYMVHSAGSEESRQGLADSLLAAWVRVLTPEGDAVDIEGWRAFAGLSGKLLLSPRQYEIVLRLWSGGIDRLGEAEQKCALLTCGTSIFRQLCARRAEAGENGGALDGAAAAMQEKIADTWTGLFAQGYDMGDREWQSFVRFWTDAQLPEEQRDRMDAAWNAQLEALECPDARFLLRMAFVAAAPDGQRACAPSFMDSLVEAFVAWLGERCTLEEPEHWKAVCDFLNIPFLTHGQLGRLIDALAAREFFENEDLRGLIQSRCEQQWPDLSYRWKKMEYLSLEDGDERRTELLQQLLELGGQAENHIDFDRTDLQLLYEAACGNLTVQNLHLLCTAYRQAGAEERAQILAALEAGDWQGEHPEVLCTWFCQAVDEQGPEWIRRYARWWAPLVRLSGEDQQTKVMVDFLGLTEDSVSAFHQQSVTRLLLSDVGNLSYLKCFLRIAPGLSDSVRSKLECMEAENDPGQIDTVVKQCIDRKEYELAATLLLRKMDLPLSNSAVAGQLIGALYTPETLEACPALVDKIPDMLLGIQKLNTGDPQGKWKNIGRAVDICCLAGREDLFFEVLGRNVLQNYPQKCAVVIASMVLRHSFESARRWIEAAKAQSNNQYLVLLDHVIRACLESGALSHRDELLTRSIPQEGNQRSLDFYGELVTYAFDRGWEKECADAFAFLYEMDASDKALVACCIQLFMADGGELGLDYLYRVAQDYFDIAQPSYVFRAAKSLAVIHSCLPYSESENGAVVTHCLHRINADNGTQLSEIMALENQCREFLNSAGDGDRKRELLLRAATGWWKMNYETLRLITPWKELVRKLVGIYPTSFVTACICSALLNQADEQYQGEMEKLIMECGQDFHLERCARRVHCVADIAPPRIPVMERLLDRPVELPWLYPHMLESVLRNPNTDQVRGELALCLAIQNNFSYTHYQGNLYRLKEMIDTKYPEYRELMLQLLVQRSTDEVTPEALQQSPAAYLAAGDYLMTVNAAEYHLQKLEQSAEPKRFMRTLNETYRKLGQLMTGQLSAEEKRRIPLAEFMNMANLLCQSEAYKDIQTLMEPCKAKWKICIRCVQELIQGQPSNVLYALRQKPFLAHDGCAAMVAHLAYQFATAREGAGLSLLKKENKQVGRDWNWGVFRAEDISRLSHGTKAFLFAIKRRNPVPIRPFRDDIDDLVRELCHEDQFEERGSSGTNVETPREISEAYRSFRSIPYVVEQVERWLPDVPDEAEEVSRRHEELTAALSRTGTDAERIDCYGQLIALDWNSEGSTTMCWYCVEMGLRLFDEACEQDGMRRYATPKARKILYDMVVCLPGIAVSGSIAGRIKTDLQESLDSYDDLSELISDCNQPYMLKLCQAITDGAVQKSLRAHILSVREIGNMMSASMTNTERLNWLRDCITKSRTEINNFNSKPKQSLIKLLNQQVLLLQGMARVALKVYNETGTQGEGHLFGKIENLGAQSVSNVHLELSLDGVVVNRYLLTLLEGGCMVPFDLTYEVDEDRETLSYSLSGKFSTEDGKEEQIVPVEGELRLEDSEELDCVYDIYKVDTPATKGNYTERMNVQKILNAYYGPQKSFEEFPNLAIYGMKRTGKTSVLRRLERMFGERPEGTLYYVETSGEGVTGSIVERVHDILVKQVLVKLEARFREDPDWESFSRRWKAVPEETVPQKWDWLDAFYTALNRQWFHGAGFVVLVDEVENLYWEYEEPSEGADEAPESGQQADDVTLYLTDSDQNQSGGTDTSGLWDTMSRITQRENASLRFILCGSDFFINKIIEGDNLTQFFQRIKKLSVGRMERAELEQTMRSIEQEGVDLSLHPDAIEYLWTITGGLPWHSKVIGNTIIENRLIKEEGAVRETIYPSDIAWGTDRILTSPVISSDNNYGLAALTADEQIILNILTEELKTITAKVSDTQLRERFHAVVGDESWESRYERAMKILLSERQMLRRSRTNRDEQYQFGCELYRLYNRRKHPAQFVLR